MVGESEVSFTLPNMRTNPFNVKPLNQNERDLLVGRKEIISKILSWCKHRSSRMILLVGNRGTGRTSLLNLLGNEAFRHFQFNIFPTKEPMKRLLEELYITVVADFEVPRLSQQLQDNLKKALPKNGRLPILSFDYPNINGSEIADVFKQISQIIRSLDAISIIALTPAQLATWPQELVDEFDEEIEIKSFDNQEIFELIKKRVTSTSRNNWTPPQELIDEIEERAGGHPSESIKLMRKIVHSIKSDQTHDNEIQEIFQRISISDNNSQKKPTIEALDEEEKEFENEFDKQDLDNEEFITHGFNSEEFDEDELDNEILEFHNLESESLTNREKNNNEHEVKDSEINESYLDYNTDSVNYQKLPLPKGGFGRLSGRTRNTNDLMRKEGYAVFPSDYETMKKIHNSQTSETPIIEREDVTLWVDETSVENNQFNNNIIRTSKSLEENNLIELQDENYQNEKFEKSLSQIQNLNNLSKNEVAFNLNIDKLRQLDNNEIKIIRMSSEREISPSDIEMRSILGGIGRTRLSQIFNKLNKDGILSVKKVGRSRMFYLSSSAKSQLKAWGIL